jgi:hypothetical protein
LRAKVKGQNKRELEIADFGFEISDSFILQSAIANPQSEIAIKI